MSLSEETTSLHPGKPCYKSRLDQGDLSPELLSFGCADQKGILQNISHYWP